MRGLLIVLFVLFCSSVNAGEVTVAVASNFAPAMKALVDEHHARSVDKVRVSYGSTGKLYAQIQNGAPFDIFLAADSRRPMRLAEEGRVVPDSRFTYVYGRLVLWSAVDPVTDGEQRLRDGDYTRLAIANPRIAPYGVAAEQVLRTLGIYTQVQSRLVYGENIAQTHQFVAGGAAELGFVALSQLSGINTETDTYWTVPQALYDPIQQQAVLLNDAPAARTFYRFLGSAAARRIIARYGYRLPEGADGTDE